MDLEERVTAIESRLSDLLGRVAALQCAVHAVAMETELVYRPALFDDLCSPTKDAWSGRAIEDAQLDHAERGLEAVKRGLDTAFYNALLHPDFRNPPRRRKDGLPWTPVKP